MITEEQKRSDIICKMIEEAPFSISDRLIPYISEAMKIYAAEQLKGELLAQRLKAEMIKTLSSRPDEMDKKYLTSGMHSYTKKDLVYNLEKDTDFGVHLLYNILSLALDLMARGKESVERPQKGEGAGRWVNVSDRWPDSWRIKIARFIHTKVPLLDPGEFLMKHPDQSNVIEWLDESESSPSNKEAIEFAEWCFDTGHTFSPDYSGVWFDRKGEGIAREELYQLYLTSKEKQYGK